jgi:uncharacterized protein YdbL (DUF1318 family)
MMLPKSVDMRLPSIQFFWGHGAHLLTQVLLGFSLSVLFAVTAQAAADLDVNTPAVAAVKASMQNRHGQLLPHYQSGAVGLTAEGFVAVKDASLVPLSQRGALAALVKEENMDRLQLYHGIAVANGHPEWEGEIQHTFALRWIDKAQPGWLVQRDGQWVKK